MPAPDPSVPDDPLVEILAANPNDVATLLILADQFEENGDLVRAQFLRNEHAFRTTTTASDVLVESQRKLAERIVKAGNELWFEEINHPRIRGTTWEGTTTTHGETHPFTARFVDNGELNYTQTSGTFQNGLWKQRGSLVTFEMNRGYAEYVGAISGLAQMTGKAKNVVKLLWTWALAPAATGVEVPTDTNPQVYAYTPRKLNRPAKKSKRKRAAPAGRAKPTATKKAAPKSAKAAPAKPAAKKKPPAAAKKPAAKKPAAKKPAAKKPAKR